MSKVSTYLEMGEVTEILVTYKFDYLIKCDKLR
jgi:hypothetical protein